VLYDVETGLSALDVPTPWLIGASGVNDPVQQWLAVDDDEAKRRVMFKSFLAYVRERGAPVCSWSGTAFDDRAVAQGIARWYPEGAELWDSVPKLDLLTIMRRTYEVPGSWSLKAIAALLGWSHPASSDWDGFQVGLAYEAYRRLDEPFDVPAILDYNRQDVEQLQWIYGWYQTHADDNLSVGLLPSNERSIAYWTSSQTASLLDQLAAGLSIYETCILR